MSLGFPICDMDLTGNLGGPGPGLSSVLPLISLRPQGGRGRTARFSSLTAGDSCARASLGVATDITEPLAPSIHLGEREDSLAG